MRVISAVQNRVSSEEKGSIKSNIRRIKNKRIQYAKLAFILSLINIGILGYVIWLLQKV